MNGHYFDDDPAIGSAPREVTFVVDGQRLTMSTDRGVFGYGALDRGTQYLIEAAPAPADEGDLLDLGCGAGAIALALAVRSPRATVWAVDVNTRARELCAANAAANGLANIRVAAPGEVPADVCFATVWSNPPIRVGKAVLHEILLTWLPRLSDSGSAVLVVHKHLGSDSLQRWLTERGHPTVRLSSRSGYRLLRVDADARQDRRNGWPTMNDA